MPRIRRQRFTNGTDTDSMRHGLKGSVSVSQAQLAVISMAMVLILLSIACFSLLSPYDRMK
jgi:hypothetical protein